MGETSREIAQMNRLLSYLVAIALTPGASGVAFGGQITVLGHTGDGVVDVNGLPQDFDFPTLRAGVGGDNVRGLAPVFIFALPDVPSPSAIVGADLALTYLGISQGSPGIFVAPEFSIDLFGIGARATPTVLGSDYYDGDATFSADTLITEGLITPSTAPGTLHASGTNLLSFITSLYNPDGTPVAPYVAFRVNPDVHLPNFSGRLRGYELASADNTASGGAFVPQLSLTVVPEPGTLGLSLVGAAVLVGGGVSRNRSSRRLRGPAETRRASHGTRTEAGL